MLNVASMSENIVILLIDATHESASVVTQSQQNAIVPLQQNAFA
jgi:hypothetical protein